MEVLDFIRNGGETVRFHTWPVLRRQTVAEHSFHVAMLYSLMAGDSDYGVSVPGLMAALTHDLAEHKMGDLPAPVKRSMPESYDNVNGPRPFREVWNEMEDALLRAQSLDWESHLDPLTSGRWLKLADAMEGALYCMREREMGNKLMATPFGNFRQYIRDVIGDSDVAPMEEQIINYIDDMWEQANA